MEITKQHQFASTNFKGDFTIIIFCFLKSTLSTIYRVFIQLFRIYASYFVDVFLLLIISNVL